MTDINTGDAKDGPGYVDLRQMQLEASATDLTLRMEVSQNVPSDPDGTVELVAYYLLIDFDGDEFQERSIDIDSADDWTYQVTNWETTRSEAISSVVIDGKTVRGRADMGVLDLPCEFRVKGLVQYTYMGDQTDIDEWIELEDEAPDGDQWVTIATG